MRTNLAARFDQASGLRRLSENRPVRTLAVASGKGGVGKTNVSVNLAVALAERGRQVMLLDADLGLGNVDVLLGLTPTLNLAHVFSGEARLDQVIVEGPMGLRIVPAASGIQRLASLDAAPLAALIHGFSELSHGLDWLIVDTAAGISDSVTQFASACEEVAVVVCDEPAARADAYALIKVLNRDHGIQRFRILANRVQGPDEGRALYGKLLRVTDRFLSVSLDYWGHIPEDEALRRAVKMRRPVVQAYPGAPSTAAFKKLVQLADNWPVGDQASGRVQFFFERLLRAEGGEPAWA